MCWMLVEIVWNSSSGMPDVNEMPVPARDECREPSVYAVTIELVSFVYSVDGGSSNVKRG